MRVSYETVVSALLDYSVNERRASNLLTERAVKAVMARTGIKTKATVLRHLDQFVQDGMGEWGVTMGNKRYHLYVTVKGADRARVLGLLPPLV